MNNAIPLIWSDTVDVHNLYDNRQLAIDKVGIKGIRQPVIIRDRSGVTLHTVANFSMYVGLPHNKKGTHMSRFVELLSRKDSEFSIQSFGGLTQEMTDRLEAESGHLEMSFPYFMEKSAPVSMVKSLMDYRVTLIGSILRGAPTISLRIEVPVTSLCPCSKEISDRGAHNQRSVISVTVRISGSLWIEELIELVERHGSCSVYGLLKRPDEKYITELAYDNPKFVEDITRDVASDLSRHSQISAYTVETENFESIHNHSAYALIAKA